MTKSDTNNRIRTSWVLAVLVCLGGCYDKGEFADVPASHGMLKSTEGTAKSYLVYDDNPPLAGLMRGTFFHVGELLGLPDLISVLGWDWIDGIFGGQAYGADHLTILAADEPIFNHGMKVLAVSPFQEVVDEQAPIMAIQTWVPDQRYTATPWNLFPSVDCSQGGNGAYGNSFYDPNYFCQAPAVYGLPFLHHSISLPRRDIDAVGEGHPAVEIRLVTVLPPQVSDPVVEDTVKYQLDDETIVVPIHVHVMSAYQPGQYVPHDIFAPDGAGDYPNGAEWWQAYFDRRVVRGDSVFAPPAASEAEAELDIHNKATETDEGDLRVFWNDDVRSVNDQFWARCNIAGPTQRRIRMRLESYNVISANNPGTPGNMWIEMPGDGTQHSSDCSSTLWNGEPGGPNQARFQEEGVWWTQALRTVRDILKRPGSELRPGIHIVVSEMDKEGAGDDGIWGYGCPGSAGGPPVAIFNAGWFGPDKFWSTGGVSAVPKPIADRIQHELIHTFAYFHGTEAPIPEGGYQTDQISHWMNHFFLPSPETGESLTEWSGQYAESMCATLSERAARYVAGADSPLPPQ